MELEEVVMVGIQRLSFESLAAIVYISVLDNPDYSTIKVAAKMPYLVCQKSEIQLLLVSSTKRISPGSPEFRFLCVEACHLCSH